MKSNNRFYKSAAAGAFLSIALLTLPPETDGQHLPVEKIGLPKGFVISIYALASGLNMPNGVAVKGGFLFVTEVSRILRHDDVESRLGNPPDNGRDRLGDDLPPDDQIFITENGSWNRTTPIGYRVTLVRIKYGRPGWLQGKDAWGRPVDIEHLPDGSLLNPMNPSLQVIKEHL